MKVLKNETQLNLENTLINNATKDLTETIIFEILTIFKKPVVFINEGISSERMEKNLKFFNPEIKTLFIEESNELYTFSAQNLEKNITKIEAIKNLLINNYNIISLDYKLLLRKLPPFEFFTKNFKLEIGERFGHQNLVNALFECGFTRCETVFEIGEFAVRGFIIDLFTIKGAFRIEFEGESISSIHKFNVETQRKESEGYIKNLEFGNIKEIVLNNEFEKFVKMRCFELEIDFAQQLLNEIQNFGTMGLFNFLPLFFKNCSNILEYLPKEAIFIKSKNLEITLEFFTQNLQILESSYLKNGKTLLPLKFLIDDTQEVLNKLSPAFNLASFF